ncbi:hypothetical protein ERJ75_000880000 [Trypanosoma vivax]|uniref:Uncharacterized protein n=1 Tax=Trypanosoma vivax (strain Y486) TaxID=1055687 RepID=G0TRD0_TRYVY|nr:hypothetical protein TRVL_01989 [Trypanosoma vivax]KAH8612568.1 hypothetical protein ERJ75_000880000 [Trypanosoma vivax]CCC46494.1 conserved hypothetical protein [Trypanosoma vivax Y486]
MHVVSDLQRRPKKARLKSEFLITKFYSLCTLLQLVCVVVYTTQYCIYAKRTFVNSVWKPNDLQLTPSLSWLVKNCSHRVTETYIYAFSGVSVLVSSESAEEMLAELAARMLWTVFFSIAVLVIGVANRFAVKKNFFEFTWRNFVVRKDLLFAADVVCLSLLARAFFMADAPRRILLSYMEHCNSGLKGYMPYCSLTPLFIFIITSCFAYVLGGVVYLFNTLPKHGVMSEEEIVEYEKWKQRRQERAREMKRMQEEIRKENLRRHLMVESEAFFAERDTLGLTASAGDGTSAMLSTEAPQQHYVMHPQPQVGAKPVYREEAYTH